MEVTLKFLLEEEDYQRAYIERILGITWDKNIVAGMMRGGGGKSFGKLESVHIPLTLALRPELLKDVQTILVPNKGVSENVGSDVEDLSSLNKDEFLDFFNSAAGYLPPKK